MPDNASPTGLTLAQVRALQQQYGPNAVPEPVVHPWRQFAARFWGPVPWMLELAVVLQLVLAKWAEAAVMALLLTLNAVVSFLQERKADRTVALLQHELAVTCRVQRDGAWQRVPAAELVPGDRIHLRNGDFVPADVQVADGSMLVDQSALTGEALPVEAGAGSVAYAGSLVRRGEATGTVSATGTRTFFGKTAELVRVAKSPGHLSGLIMRIVRVLIVFDALLAAAVAVYATATGMPLHELLPYLLILLVASVPAALPATFALATAMGSRQLAAQGVLVTRLSAIEEAAGMDVLASDKTGTLTANQLSVAATVPLGGADSAQLWRYAALACDEATQDPIDLAILDAARAQGALADLPLRLSFTPFDPQTKRSEATYAGSPTLRVIKGAPATVAQLAPLPGLDAQVDALASAGWRVLGVAAGAPDALRFAALVALEDPPRSDSAAVVARLQAMGIRVIMVTGDGLATAQAIAARVGVPGSGALRDGIAECAKAGSGIGVLARVLPEDKYLLVKALQDSGHAVGMTGDGVNDAPALKQADVGIAVANATDVAKSAASVVLTRPGLADVETAVRESRRISRRMLTYTLNKIIKTLEIAVLLSLGVMLTGMFVVTPLLIVLLLFTNDFVTMSLAADHAQGAQRPVQWQMKPLFTVAGALAACVLALSFTVFLWARAHLPLTPAQLQTLVFLLLVFSGQGVVYLVRHSGPLWQSRPSRTLLLASVLDIAVVSALAVFGVLMAPLPAMWVGALLVGVAAYLAVLDVFKVWLLHRCGMA